MYDIEMTEKDINDFIINNVRISPYLKKVFIYGRYAMLTWFIIPLTIILLNYANTGNFSIKGLEGVLIVGIIMNIIWAVFYMDIYRFYVKSMRLSRHSKYPMNIPINIMINSNNIEVRTNSKETIHPWSSIEYVMNDDKFIYIYRSKNTGVLIPSSKFKNQVEYHEYIKKLKKYHKIARKNQSEVARR